MHPSQNNDNLLLIIPNIDIPPPKSCSVNITINLYDNAYKVEQKKSSLCLATNSDINDHLTSSLNLPKLSHIMMISNKATQHSEDEKNATYKVTKTSLMQQTCMNEGNYKRIEFKPLFQKINIFHIILSR